VALPCCHDEADDSTGDNGNEQQQQQQQEVYFYNTATKSIRWSLPEELQQLLDTQDTKTAAAAAVPGPPGAAEAGASATAVAAPAAAANAVLNPTAYQALLDLQEERVMPNLSAIKAGKQVTHVLLTGCTAMGLYCLRDVLLWFVLPSRCW
jgi:hypothetical protein